VNIVIAGGGRGGLAVATYLASAGHGVTLVDRDATATRLAFEAHGIASLTGDATDARVLAEATRPSADVLVAMLPRDADNLAVALLGRRAGVGRIMVRVKDESYRQIYLDAGVHRLMSERDVLVGAFAATIEHEEVRSSLLLGAGDGLVFELLLPDASPLAGLSVGEIAALPGFPPSCVFAGLYANDGRIVAPRGGSLVAGGALLLLVAQRHELARVVDFFTRSPRPATSSPHRSTEEPT
jgi:trk system potassium uptake protein TrkA